MKRYLVNDMELKYEVTLMAVGAEESVTNVPAAS